MKHIQSAKFKKTELKVPIISVMLDGIEEPLYALVDTGSELTLFDKSLLPHLDVVNGQTDVEVHMESFLGDAREGGNALVNANLKLGEDDLVISGVTADLSFLKKMVNRKLGRELDVAILIGSDTLTAHGASVDFLKNRVSFHDLSDK